MQAAVMIHRMLWWKKGCAAAMQARCDSQNALVQGRVCYPLRCHACCCMIHNALVEKKGAIPCAAMCSLLL
jgi:hypothetical protein